MVMGEITIAILKQHQIIDKNLIDFEKTPEGGQMMIKLFETFRWNLNKHMFIEEENIFPVTDDTNNIEKKQLQNLIKDHRDLTEIIKNLSEDIANGRKPNTKILRELLFAHEAREIQSFYPLLDKRLSANTKNEILLKLKDVKII
ncbi:MAG: hemerythrin domain-containing protein [Nanoarchaeota archaeon]